jgi:hypothetical protein
MAYRLSLLFTRPCDIEQAKRGERVVARVVTHQAVLVGDLPIGLEGT